MYGIYSYPRGFMIAYTLLKYMYIIIVIIIIFKNHVNIQFFGFSFGKKNCWVLILSTILFVDIL